MPYTVFCKAPDGTTFAVPFRDPILVARATAPVPVDADFVFDGKIKQGNFRVIDGPLRLRHDGGDPVEVQFDNGQHFTVPAGYELPLVHKHKIHLGYTMWIEPTLVPPAYDLPLPYLQGERLPPCALDKAALGGPDAILAVARNPNLTKEQLLRWAGCPWTACLALLERNRNCPADLRSDLESMRLLGPMGG